MDNDEQRTDVVGGYTISGTRRDTGPGESAWKILIYPTGATANRTTGYWLTKDGFYESVVDEDGPIKSMPLAKPMQIDPAESAAIYEAVRKWEAEAAG